MPGSTRPRAWGRRFTEKTIAAHLTSIRDFERFLGEKAFEKVTPKDAGAYRDALVKLGKAPRKSGGLSSSTIRHRVSHLIDFFGWLKHQEGFRRLRGDIPRYLALPRWVGAKPLGDGPKPFPSIEEAISMSLGMPHRTMLERRDRAMVALTFVSGLRAGALTSLRLKHLDMDAKEVIQDGSEMRAKNGKSFRVFWFPRTEDMQGIFCEWVAEIQQLGFEAADAVFPVEEQLTVQASSHRKIEPMRTESALRAAFTKASKRIDKNFSPHSARHCLAALGNRLCLSPERRKAWSLNLGHETEAITETYYAKMSDGRRSEVIGELCSREVWTDDEKDLMLDYHQHRLLPTTQEFRKARKLVLKRESVWDGDN